MRRYYAWLLAVTAMVITNVTYGFYDPNLQRWVNRDPYGEAGFELLRGDQGGTRAIYAELLPEGPNMYDFIANDAIDYVDPDGKNRLYQRFIFPVINWLNNTRASQWAGRQLDKALQCCISGFKSSSPDKNFQRVLELAGRISAGQGNQVVKELEVLSQTPAGRQELLKMLQAVSAMIPCAQNGAQASTMIGLQQVTGALARGGR